MNGMANTPQAWTLAAAMKKNETTYNHIDIFDIIQL